MKLDRIVVLGGGSAGLLAAITLRRAFPERTVRLIRSPEIGVIGVGEGTTPAFPNFLHEYLQIPPQEFHERAHPTWKLGLCLLWGPRKGFNYSFRPQLNFQPAGLSRAVGYYVRNDFDDLNVWSALMRANRAFAPQAGGAPRMDLTSTPYHIENLHLVEYLEWRAREDGVEVLDDTVAHAIRDGEGVLALELTSGRRVEGDFFVDASGFRSKLLGETLGEPFIDYGDALFCDRAVVGPRGRREGEVIRPYTIAETMDHGWCWQIEHEHHVNRGYVYSSAFVNDDEAEAEFRRINPDVQSTRIVKFVSGRYRRSWIGNVVAVGNASGFVEPLEATALTVLTSQCRNIVNILRDNQGDVTPTKIALYNNVLGGIWDHVRDFLALHYRFNERRDTGFWRHCREKTPVGDLEPLVNFYRENGPSLVSGEQLIPANSYFGVDGIYTMLAGMKVPYERPFHPSESERKKWEVLRAENLRIASRGITVAEALAILRRPDVVWA